VGPSSTGSMTRRSDRSARRLPDGRAGTPPPQRTDEDEPRLEVVDLETSRRRGTEDIDDLLDEIDSVLEENAEEFVKNYVQKGGE
jgi:prokaryotic ubiquitin-like protein Pup